MNEANKRAFFATVLGTLILLLSGCTQTGIVGFP